MTNPTNVSSDNVGLNSAWRARSRSFGVLAMALAFLGAPLAACSGASGGGGTGGSTSAECKSDAECKGDHVCEHGACVAPAQSAPDAGSTGHDSAAPDSAPPPPPPPDTCSANSDCATGCCHNSVCAVASMCPTPPPPPPPPPVCHNPGQSCTGRSDCCQSGGNVGPHGAVCLSDDGACHAECFYSSECASNCCVKLTGVSYGACGSSAGHTCI